MKLTKLENCRTQIQSKFPDACGGCSFCSSAYELSIVCRLLHSSPDFSYCPFILQASLCSNWKTKDEREGKLNMIILIIANIH